MAVCFLSAIIGSAELVLANIYLTEPIYVQKWQLGLFIIPFIISAVSFLPLMYLTWFQGQSAGTMASLQKGVFWMFAFGLMTVLFLIIYLMVYSEKTYNKVLEPTPVSIEALCGQPLCGAAQHKRYKA